MEIANELHPIELQALQFMYCMHAAELRRLYGRALLSLRAQLRNSAGNRTAQRKLAIPLFPYPN